MAMENVALRACSACRKQKRKCTKELPDCSLCLKNRRACDYGDSLPAVAFPGPGAQEASQRAIDICSLPMGTTMQPQLPSINFAQSEFPACFFLDHETFQLLGMSINVAATHFPRALLDFPANHDGIDPLSRETYKTAKAYLAEIEASNVISVRLLQAALLISLYEVSNGMFPTAYLTVGHCARLGHALGIHARKRAPQVLSPPVSSTELEERSRVWWGVIILDRYVGIGGKCRPFACDDARPDTYLPIDDTYWDQGQPTLVQPLAVSTSTNIAISPFARTCQAAHLLSRVLRHLSDCDTDPEFRYQEAIQIDRTIQALSTSALLGAEESANKTSDPTENLLFCTAISLCFSALFCLYSEYSCTESFAPEQLKSSSLQEMQRRALSGLEEICEAVLRFSKSVYVAVEIGGTTRVSPLICDCLYQAASTYLWYSRESGDQQWHEKVIELKMMLEIIGQRWQCANEYMKILEAYETSDKIF
ncbi:hypothetical protein TWF173_004614 [Orbilia oligospora]|nr:hypothetical protein TWF173_004614 [Orbilia oligospora]